MKYLATTILLVLSAITATVFCAVISIPEPEPAVCRDADTFEEQPCKWARGQ